MRVDGRDASIRKRGVYINERNMSVFFLHVVNHRRENTHGMATVVFWRTFYNGGKFSEAWWGWKAPHTPFRSIYHHEQSCGVRSSWEGRYTPCTYFSSVLIALKYTQKGIFMTTNKINQNQNREDTVKLSENLYFLYVLYSLDRLSSSSLILQWLRYKKNGRARFIRSHTGT